MPALLRQISTNEDEKQICICVGNIGNPYHPNKNYDTFMKFINANFVKTFVIPGNHEYYHKTKTVHETNAFLENYFKQFDNICFLNNTFEIYNDYCFIGSPLWSQIHSVAYNMNICNIPGLNYQICKQQNQICKLFLENVLSQNQNCIIITNHIPTFSCIDEIYRTFTKNEWYMSDTMDILKIYKKNIRYWFYGNSATPKVQLIYDITFLTNPIGVSLENKKPDFDKNVIIRIDTEKEVEFHDNY